jgi:hypothetical protein
MNSANFESGEFEGSPVFAPATAYPVSAAFTMPLALPKSIWPA